MFTIIFYILFKIITLYYFYHKYYEINQEKNNIYHLISYCSRTFVNYTNITILLYIYYEYFIINTLYEYIYYPIIFTSQFSITVGYWTIIYTQLSTKEKNDKLNMALDIIGHGPIMFIFLYNHICSVKIYMYTLIYVLLIPILWYVIINKLWFIITNQYIYDINKKYYFYCLIYIEILNITSFLGLYFYSIKYCEFKIK